MNKYFNSFAAFARVSVSAGVALFCAVCAQSSAFAESASQSGADAAVLDEDKAVFDRAFAYYLKADFPSARELFTSVGDGNKALKAQAQLYLASIAANSGDGEEASKNYLKAIANGDAAISLEAKLQYAKFLAANSDFARLAELVGDTEKNGVLLCRKACALFVLGKEAQASALLERIDFTDKSSLGADLAVYCALESGNQPYAKPLSDSLEKLLSSSSDVCALSRLAVLGGKVPDCPQKAAGVLAQTKMLEAILDGRLADGAFSLEEFINMLRPARNLEFAHEGSYAAARYAFRHAQYAAAAAFANDAFVLADPQSRSRFAYKMLLGDSLRMQGQYAAARDAYLDIAMKPRQIRGEPMAEALYKTGLCWFEQGQWEKAHLYFERVWIAFFSFEYWGARAYYYDAQALFSLGRRRDANATLLEYFKRAKDKNSAIYKAAKDYYDKI